MRVALILMTVMAAAVGTAFRIKRRLDSFHMTTETAHHIGNDVIRPNTDAAGEQLHWH
jgi:hypothetical protein